MRWTALQRYAQDRVPLAESEIMRAVFAHLHSHGVPGLVAFHPKNEGVDQRRNAGINAGLGVVSGMPDVIAIAAGKLYALELKTRKGG
jgi:hypothetical protein